MAQNEQMRGEFEHELAAAAEQLSELEAREDRTALLEQAVAAREAELERRREAEQLRSEAFDRLQGQLRQREVDLGAPEGACATARRRTPSCGPSSRVRSGEAEARAQIARLEAACSELERTVAELGERSDADNDSREQALNSSRPRSPRAKKGLPAPRPRSRRRASRRRSAPPSWRSARRRCRT